MPEPLGDEVSRLLPRLRIDELLDEVQTRLASVRSTRDRVSQLLDAVIGIGSGLDLEQTLGRIVQAAAALIDARCGALGVLGPGRRPERFLTVGMTDDETAAIERAPEGRDMLGAPIRVRGEVFGKLYLTDKRAGAPFDGDDEAVLTALAAAAGIAIDNARLYDEARRRQEWLEITADLSRGLLSSADSDTVLAAFVHRVRLFARADLALVAVPGPESGEMVIVAADGDEEGERLRGSVFGVEETLLGHVYKSGERAMVADLQRDERAHQEGSAQLGLGPALIVPLGGSGRSRGAVSLSRRSTAAPFEPELADLTAELAVQAAVVLELAERRRDSELLSLYADRDRIGRDLHDLAIQRLFATSMSLQGAYKITEKQAVARRIASAVADLDDTIKVIRSTIFALHSHGRGGDVLGVRAQVIEVCEQAVRPLGFTPSVLFNGPVDSLVGWQIAEQLLAVLREALSNTARHARATRAEVELTADPQTVTLTVADDGAGIGPGGRRSGLANLESRAAQLGGGFSVQPGRSGGTVLRWTAPTAYGREGGTEVPNRTVRRSGPARDEAAGAGTKDSEGAT